MARRRRRIRRGVRVRRVVRRVELGSLFRLAVAFHLLCWAVSMAVLAIVANIVDRLGLLGRVEKFLQDAGFAKGFKVDLSILLRAAAGVGLGLVIVAVVATMLLGFFFNGVSGLLGGLVVTVLEERPPLPKPTPGDAAMAAADAALDPADGPSWDDTPTMWDMPAPSGPSNMPAPAAAWDISPQS